MEINELYLDHLNSYSDLYFYKVLNDEDTIMIALSKSDDFDYFDTIDRISHYLRQTIYK